NGHSDYRLGVANSRGVLVVRVVVIPVAELIRQAIGAPPGQADRGCDRVIVPQVVPLPPVPRGMAPVPASVVWVMIVEPVLPVLPGLIAIILPILANLIPLTLPILPHLAPVALRTIRAAFSGQSIAGQSVAKALAPILA